MVNKMEEEQKTMLSITISTGEALNKVLLAIKEGKDYIEMPAWKNEAPKGLNSPQFKSRGLSVWVKKYTPKQKEVTEDLLGDDL